MCYDSETPRVFNARTIVGRKPHACDECGEPIAAGARHEHVAGNWDGRWYRFRTCLGCVSLRAAVVERELAEGCAEVDAYPPFGDLWPCATEAEVVCAWPDEEARAYALENDRE